MATENQILTQYDEPKCMISDVWQIGIAAGTDQ
jgi:hypothetical protein